MKCLLLVGLTSVLLTYPLPHSQAAEASTYQASCQEKLAPLTISGMIRPPVQLEPFHIMILALLATCGIAGLWWIFWNAFLKSQDSGKIMDVLNTSSFLKTVTVVGVIAAAAVLSLAGILEGNVAGAILSGIVGYVLGQSSNDSRRNVIEKTEKSDTEGAA